jgi:hypothetical protein
MPRPEYPGLPAEDGQIYQERLIAILSGLSHGINNNKS